MIELSETVFRSHEKWKLKLARVSGAEGTVGIKCLGCKASRKIQSGRPNSMKRQRSRVVAQ